MNARFWVASFLMPTEKPDRSASDNRDTCSPCKERSSRLSGFHVSQGDASDPAAWTLLTFGRGRGEPRRGAVAA